MNAGKMTFAAALIAGLASPAASAQACGHGSVMALPVPGYAVAPLAAVPPIGLTVTVLPPGCTRVMVSGAPFFRMGPVWYQPIRGPMGPRFRVVPAPYGM